MTEKDKTNTKTLEIPTIKNGSKENNKQAERSINEITDPAVKVNKTDDEKVRKGTQVLLHANKALEEKDDNDIEFSASTAVFQMTDELKESLEELKNSDQSTSSDNAEPLNIDENQTVKVNISSERADQETVDEIKKKVKIHYIKKARVLEAEINKVLATFKTTNPSIQKKIAHIQKLLAVHSSRKKKG